MCYNETKPYRTISKRKGGKAMEPEISNHQDFYIDRIRRVEGYSMSGPHLHEQYEIYYEIDGTRRYFIGDGAYLVNAGDLVLVDKNQVHRTSAVNSDGNSRIVCNFGEKFLEEIQRAFPSADFTGLFQGEVKVFKLSVKDQAQVYGTLNQLVESFREDSPIATVYCKLQLAGLLIFLRELWEQKLAAESKKVTNAMVDSIQSYIAQHYAEPLTLKGLAAQFYISPYYLSRLFKKTVNLSLIEYINGVRIKAAQHLLEEGDVSIAYVAEKTGFSTTAHFRRVFKEATGLNPQKYRKGAREAREK